MLAPCVHDEYVVHRRACNGVDALRLDLICQLDVKLGEVYFGTGDYQNAVAAINRGLQKGQVKQLDEAYVYLGRSYAALKNYPEAKKAFAQLKTVPKISPRVLKLWETYADKLGSASA